MWGTLELQCCKNYPVAYNFLLHDLELGEAAKSYLKTRISKPPERVRERIISLIDEVYTIKKS